MESVLGKLIKYENSPKDSVDRILSQKLFDNFLKGIFQNQQDLAKELFISESAITKFCQKMDYSGFREFNERFKIEYEKYEHNQNQNLNFDSFAQKILFSLKDIKGNHEFSDSLRTAVFEKKGLFIFSSYQAESAALFLRDYLVNEDINVKCFNAAKDIHWSAENVNGNDYPILFIFTGPDTNLLLRFYNKFRKQNKNLFLIVSNGQNDRFVDCSQKFVLTSYVKYSSFYYRTVILELIFLAIFEQTNETF